jgi:hypothetical protein
MVPLPLAAGPSTAMSIGREDFGGLAGELMEAAL